MTDKRKTLVILSPGFPANEADTNCIPFPQQFVRRMKELNPSLNIIVLAFQYPYRSEKYTWHDITVIPFNGRNRSKISRLILWKSVWNRLCRILNENNVTGILNLWLGECALIGKYAARKYRVKQFTWLLGQDAKKGNRYFSLINPKAETLIALSDSIAAELYRNYAVTPLHIIPPGIDHRLFENLPPKPAIDIIGVGSLIPLKQYEIFIRCIAILVQQYPSIHTIICGEGKEHSRLQEMITSNKLDKNILLSGELPHEEVLAYMKSSKILLHPSSYEGFSTACNEALFTGLQVVSFCKPMNRDFKNFHTVNTEQEMAEKLSELMLHKELQKEAVLTYAMEEVCEKISKLYEI